MRYNDIKRVLSECPDLAGLDENSAADLFWRGEEQTLREGQVVYAEGTPLDDTFGLLLSGDLIIERGGTILGGISEQQLFGEMAYFNNECARTATVRVGSPHAVILKFHLSPAELRSARFSALRQFLALHTWNKFVHTSQSGAGCEQMALNS